MLFIYYMYMLYICKLYIDVYHLISLKIPLHSTWCFREKRLPMQQQLSQEATTRGVL